MFVLTKFKYTAKINAVDFRKDFVQALIDRIDAEFSNYVIIDVGLCISFYDFVKIGDSFLMPGDAGSFTPVEFRYIVFQPFRGEVLEGNIASCSSEGIRISMVFFSDIIIPPDKMPQVSVFDDSEQLWYWEYPTDDGTVLKFYMEPGKRVKFRVADFHYRSVEPGAADVKVFEIIGLMSETGLGCPSWWESAAEEEPAADDPGVDENEAMET